MTELPDSSVDPGRRVVCAANRNRFGEVILGARHWDKWMREQAGESLDDWRGVHEQGFIDNRGNFLSREEAWLVAENAGQIIRRCGGDMVNGVGVLYSENLY